MRQNKFNPIHTPLLIKRLIAVTAILSLFCSLAEEFIHHVFNAPGPMAFLALNTSLFLKGYLFQLVTYPLTFGEIGEGVSFSYMFILTLNLYILWVTGSHIVERMGKRTFVKLYLFSTIVSGLVGVILAILFRKNQVFSSCIPQMLASLFAWTVLNGEGKLYLFPPFSIKAKWVTLFILFITILSSLSSLDLPLLGFYTAGALSGWLYALFSWHLKSPWVSIKELENRILVAIAKAKLFFKHRNRSKIIDIRSIQEADDLFMDEMLEKISKYGESSLSPLERKRMQKISRKKHDN